MGRERLQVEKLDQGMSQVPRGTEWDEVIFHHATQNSVHFKTDELFPSGIFPLIYSDHDWLWSLEQQNAVQCSVQCFQKGGGSVTDLIYPLRSPKWYNPNVRAFYKATEKGNLRFKKG